MASSSTFFAREVYGRSGPGAAPPFALADQAEEDVLGADVLMVQPRGFFPRHLQDLPDSIGKVVAVHGSLGVTSSSLAVRGRSGPRRLPASVSHTQRARSANPGRSKGALPFSP